MTLLKLANGDILLTDESEAALNGVWQRPPSGGVYARLYCAEWCTNYLDVYGRGDGFGNVTAMANDWAVVTYQGGHRWLCPLHNGRNVDDGTAAVHMVNSGGDGWIDAPDLGD